MHEFSERTNLFLGSSWCLEKDKMSVTFPMKKISEVGVPCLENVGVDEQRS